MMKTVVFIFCISLAAHNIYCGPIKIKESRLKRAIFDILPEAENREEDDRSGSSCQCSDGSSYCIRDQNLVCRRTLDSLTRLSTDENLQVVDRLERRMRRKNRRKLRNLFRKWMKEVGRESSPQKV